MIVDNGYEPAYDSDNGMISVLRDPQQPPNLSQLWNIGFDWIASRESMLGDGDGTWNIAVLNDDVVLPDGWYDYVAHELRASDAVIACTDAYASLTAPVLKTTPDGNITTRMCPWAFIIRGESMLRADETFRWWWGDTDLDWTAREHGGVLLLPGYTTQNTGANSTTHGELAEQAGRDGVAFAAKWGWRPW